MTFDKPLVSIIICTYNRKEDLLACLSSLKLINYPNLEIIVVDNGSTDGSVKEIKKDFPYVKTIRNKENLGVSYPKNQGISESKGDYIWFLDSDTFIINKNCLNNMLDFFKKNKKLGAVGGQIFREGEDLKYWVMNEKEDKKILLNKVKEPFNFKVHYLPTCNCLLQKDVLESFGGFDTEYFFYCEDLDLGLKLSKLGLENIFKSDCCVLHNFSQRGRIGDYYLFYRNLLRCLIINKSKSYIFHFPFSQLIKIYKDFKMFKRENKNLEDTRTLKNLEKQQYAGKLGEIKLGVKILSSLIKAYFWNILNLPRTLYIKNKPPHFLKNVEKLNKK